MQLKSVLSLFVCLFIFSVNLNAQDAQLLKLRNDLAMRYFEPDPHMKLARYFHDRGNKLLAFYILESARRTRFEQEVFDAAFQKHFIGDSFDNSSEAEAALMRQSAQKQDDVKVLTKLADVYVSRNDWKQAELYFEKAIKLQPDNETAVLALAEVLRRSGNEAKAESFLKTFAAKFPDSKAAFKANIAFAMQSNQPETRRLLDVAINRYPDDGYFCFLLANLLLEQRKATEAEAYFVKAASLTPDNPTVQGWTGRYFLKSRQQPEKALAYYLNAYFLDPHFYDSEHAEYRISKINGDLSEASFAQQRAAKVSLESLARSENPAVAGQAMNVIMENWKPSYVGLMVELMSHDDPNIRAIAAEALKLKTGKEFDGQLNALLADSDLRKRGLAAYIAVHHRGQNSFSLMRQWLKDDAQLIRFDAVSALLIDGGEAGKRIALAHRNEENHPWLRSLLDTVK